MMRPEISHIRRATANFPGESPAQIARHAEIERYYAWPTYQGKKFERGSPPLIARVRLRELERLFHWRYGEHLPFDDAGLEDLEIAAHHIAHLGGEVAEHIVAWAEGWMPELPRERAEALAERVKIEPRRFKAKTLGWRLGLTNRERTALQITTIEAIDVNPQERAERRKQMARERAARSYWRRKADKPPKPASLRSGKPWEKLGISQATWYRRGKPMPEAEGLRNPSAKQVRVGTICSAADVSRTPQQRPGSTESMAKDGPSVASLPPPVASAKISPKGESRKQNGNKLERNDMNQ